MAFRPLQEPKRPTKLVRKERQLKIVQREVFSALALIVSVDSYFVKEQANAEGLQSTRCDICYRTSSDRDVCPHTVNQFHIEADQIAEVFKLFDAELVQLTNPDLLDMKTAFNDIKKRLGNKLFFFAFCGRGIQTK